MCIQFWFCIAFFVTKVQEHGVFVLHQVIHPITLARTQT